MTNQSKYLSKKIYVAGHTGMVGSAITNELQKRGYKNFILKNYPDLDLIRQKDVEDFFMKS
jgi:GDP-L-fucose synthase